MLCLAFDAEQSRGRRRCCVLQAMNNAEMDHRVPNDKDKRDFEFGE